jgi:hypothetical protein
MLITLTSCILDSNNNAAGRAEFAATLFLRETDARTSRHVGEPR